MKKHITDRCVEGTSEIISTNTQSTCNTKQGKLCFMCLMHPMLLAWHSSIWPVAKEIVSFQIKKNLAKKWDEWN